MWYRSKIDWFLALPFAVLFGTGTYILWSAWRGGEQSFGRILVAIAFVVFPMWSILGTWYRIKGDTLFIRCLWVHRRVPIPTISSIEETDNPWANPALSLDRLLITYGKNAVLISPKRKREFLSEIERIKSQDP